MGYQVELPEHVKSHLATEFQFTGDVLPDKHYTIVIDSRVVPGE